MSRSDRLRLARNIALALLVVVAVVVVVIGVQMPYSGGLGFNFGGTK